MIAAFRCFPRAAFSFAQGGRNAQDITEKKRPIAPKSVGAKVGREVEEWKVRQHARSERVEAGINFYLGDLWFQGLQCGRALWRTARPDGSWMSIIIVVVIVVVFCLTTVLCFVL
jgi:hypothetical protein